MNPEVIEENGRFYIGDPEHPKAYLAFEHEGDTMTITSTVVDPNERNQGLGTELVDYAVNYARKHKLNIDPVCSFAREIIKETPEYHVVWNG
ncbi:GNAT family N-acetyltransferase [Halobacillus yeomjeoni]|uniref:N-acetyltransferase n=1 Tax=Halobacillus yeomjeoni TaxID=311194 RepID=A0A931HY67_9BACI|nr:GNAT family N-acetyltransferase [Halobacillus yeomjeoni]MBH0231609.1 N-acetyltransferase [Halobacillus yeomjeoni]